MAEFDVEDDDLMDEELDLEGSEERYANAPSESALRSKTLRACIPCLLIKSYAQFVEEGCENCEEALGLRDDENKVNECTTANFEGMVAVLQPKKSWVARWQFVQSFVPGVYAIKVKGSISKKAEDDLAEAKIPNVGKMMQQEDLKMVKTS